MKLHRIALSAGNRRAFFLSHGKAAREDFPSIAAVVNCESTAM